MQRMRLDPDVAWQAESPVLRTSLWHWFDWLAMGYKHTAEKEAEMTESKTPLSQKIANAIHRDKPVTVATLKRWHTELVEIEDALEKNTPPEGCEWFGYRAKQ